MESKKFDLKTFKVPEGYAFVYFDDLYFNDVLALYDREGWLSFSRRKEEALFVWQNSQIAVLLLHEGEVIGFMRGITDGFVSTYLSELLVIIEHRGLHLGELMMELCHKMYPRTRIDLLASKSSTGFYKRLYFKEMTGFRKSYV